MTRACSGHWVADPASCRRSVGERTRGDLSGQNLLVGVRRVDGDAQQCLHRRQVVENPQIGHEKARLD
jgi:hypothetical protein